MYAAIEDPNLYGSETYAQIQAPMTVSVEINPTAPPPTQQPSSSQSNQSTARFSRSQQASAVEDAPTATVEALKNLHSRQASSSSCTSSVGIIGSPKPEKRQANSPLPPTPKSRNSTSSVMEYHEGAKLKDSNNNSSKVKQSPSKDLEGMYAKVMKKSKLSSVPSENSSPILTRHEPTTVDEIDSVPSEPTKTNEYETIDKRNRARNVSDAGYETIPADRNNNKEPPVETATHYAQINEKPSKAKMSLFKEETTSNSDPKYETLKKVEKKEIATDSDNDPNYEIVMSNNKRSSSSSSTLVEDGYTLIAKKKASDESDDESIPGYSSIRKPESDYSSIGGREKPPLNSINDDSNIYMSIPTVITPSPDSISSEFISTTNSLATPTTVNNNNYESLDTSESTNVDEPNYESMKYLKENPYEQLQSSSPDPSAEALSPLSDTKSPAVDDFFKV